MTPIPISTASTGNPTAGRATMWQIWRTELRILVHRLVNRIGMPGCIAEFDHEDALTGQHIQVRNGIFFTVLSVNGRDYYFRRFSGSFDGTGSCCCS